MKVILIDWNSYGNQTMEALFLRLGYELRKCAFNVHLQGEEHQRALAALSDALGLFRPDYVFSFHYFPAVSGCCQERNIPYLAWVYDSPALDIYSYTVLNPVNRIFLFDRGVYEEFQKNSIPTVYHLPLGFSAERFPSGTGSAGGQAGRSFAADISFAGSLYTEPKHRLYDRFSGIDPYAKGYLDGIIEAQKHIYGENFLESLLTPAAEAEMQKAYPCDPNGTTVMKPSALYAQYVLARQVTALERGEILSLLGDRFSGRALALYTNDGGIRIPGVENRGPVDYYTEMPDVFANSRINLNITLRSILTGIPLRALDILGNGGFLLSNYQEELCELFVPGEDFAFYADYEDLMEKADYYLSHESERRAIAENGSRKVRTSHTLEQRLCKMEKTL